MHHSEAGEAVHHSEAGEAVHHSEAGGAVHHSEAGEAAEEAIRETTRQAEEAAGEAAEEATKEEGEVAEGLPLFRAVGVVFAKHGMVTTMQGSMPVIEKACPLRALNK